MRKDFFTPYKKGGNIFYCQAKFGYDSLFEENTFIVEFESTDIIGLKSKIIDYSKIYGLTFKDMSNVYVVHHETIYTETNGFNFKDVFKKEGILK